MVSCAAQARGPRCIGHVTPSPHVTLARPPSRSLRPKTSSLPRGPLNCPVCLPRTRDAPAVGTLLPVRQGSGHPSLLLNCEVSRGSGLAQVPPGGTPAPASTAGEPSHDGETTPAGIPAPRPRGKPDAARVRGRAGRLLQEGQIQGDSGDGDLTGTRGLREGKAENQNK